MESNNEVKLWLVVELADAPDSARRKDGRDGGTRTR